MMKKYQNLGYTLLMSILKENNALTTVKIIHQEICYCTSKRQKINIYSQYSKMIISFQPLTNVEEEEE